MALRTLKDDIARVQYGCDSRRCVDRSTSDTVYLDVILLILKDTLTDIAEYNLIILISEYLQSLQRCSIYCVLPNYCETCRLLDTYTQFAHAGACCSPGCASASQSFPIWCSYGHCIGLNVDTSGNWTVRHSAEYDARGRLAGYVVSGPKPPARTIVADSFSYKSEDFPVLKA